MVNPFFAQTENISKITGELIIPDGDFYVISILSSKDSSIISTTYFNTRHFLVKTQRLNNFIVQISSPLLYDTEFVRVKNEENKPTIDLGKIDLKPKVISLDEIQITAIKPKFKFLDGKLIYNIQHNENLINLNSLDDILKKIPLIITEDEKINVFGKKNTIILINGQPPKNDNWEFIQPNRIKNIEIIPNPSAEYNANGEAVINITTNNNMKVEGFNGQVNASVSKGNFLRSNNNLQLGYSTDKINLYSNISYLPSKKIYKDRYERYFSNGSIVLNDLEQIRTTNINYSVLLGVDYTFSPKHSLGIQYQKTYRESNKKTDNENNLYLLSSTARYQTLTDAKSDLGKNIYDLSYSYLLDSIGKKLTFNFGYVDYTSNENASINEVSHNSYLKNKNGISKADLSFYSTKIDYIHSEQNNFEGKIGIYYSHDRNNSLYHLINEDSGILDNDFSNEAMIKENKLAGYLTVSKKLKRISLSAGLRFEYVDYINENKDGQMNSRVYRDFFPSVDIGYSLNKRIQANLSFSRKIYRPKFQDLDPSVIYIDTLTYFAGNTNLVPEYSYNFLLNVIYNKYAVFSFGYSKVEDPIFMYIERLDQTSMIFIATTKNLNSQKKWTASFTMPYQYKFWTVQTSLGANLNDNKFFINDELKQTKKIMSYLYLYNGFKLPYETNLSVTYKYNSTGIDGIFSHNERHILSASINKAIIKNKLSVNLRYDDIFKRNKLRTHANLENVQSLYGAEYDASYVTLSVKYKFGKVLKRYSVKNNNKEGLKRIK